MTRPALRLFVVSAVFGIASLMALGGTLPFANGLYALGLWRRHTPDEVLLILRQNYRVRVSECAEGTNGWDYICQVPAHPGVRQFHDKLGVQGSVFGIASITELRFGPVPARNS